ncbi:RNA polymerase sigma factor [Cyclobacterium jeungdonense]|uniref:Sigma-70 family RNA polymerase sigma factor n=1 Tax=Cyclobacterium jeungdonense TaxID=708087 RepID=A0ABT8CCH8_9BACT|nr:sigma-70 family RNA polymerase sigma factor [Cyclobacterium jeungdonense]MDN3690519.1 sigma-70 family RNA polymerase sigma factor [Cyclobacterium jeungdonense]
MKIQENPISFQNWDDFWLLLRKGDRKGLEGIYRLFSHELFKYGLALVNDEAFIQDCIQEVFIDLWKYHPSLQRADNVKVYLFKSLSHKIYRESKKKGKWKMEGLDDLGAISYSIESMESTLIGIQREEGIQRKLANGIDNLPLRQKQVIQLLFFEQFSYEEVSKMMGINLRSVYTLAWKAISSLKKYVVSLAGIFLLIL